MRSLLIGWQRKLIWILVPIVLAGLLFVSYSLAIENPGGNDFLARWTGAHYWLTENANPYDEEVSLAAQLAFYGRPADPTKGESLAHFYYPLYSMLFFGPFGLLPYPIARTIMTTLLVIVLPILLIMGLRIANWKPGVGMMALLMGFSIFWYPGVRTIFLGQFAAVNAAFMIGALLAIRHKNDSLGGVLLALSTMKPQMSILLIPFVILWAISQKRWSLILWTAGAETALFAASLALMPDWPLRWIWQIMDYAAYTKPGQPVAIIASLFPVYSDRITSVLSVVFVLYLGLEWALAWRKGDHWFQWTAALTIVITNLIAFRTATTNYVVMLPALCIIFGSWVKRWKRSGTYTVVIVLLVLFIGMWALFLATVTETDESLVMYLPLPILTFIGLLWVRWWAIRPEKLPFEGFLTEPDL
ncbi:MAG: glycosyltransferase family 87 protein [Anaerolineales bacterium]